MLPGNVYLILMKDPGGGCCSLWKHEQPPPGSKELRDTRISELKLKLGWGLGVQAVQAVVAVQNLQGPGPWELLVGDVLRLYTSAVQ